MSRHGDSVRSAIRPLPHSSILFRPHQQPPIPDPARRLVVEAPGYCPPGPKCLFHLIVYRHSRVAPAGAKIGVRALTNKFAAAAGSGGVATIVAMRAPVFMCSQGLFQ